MGKVVQLTHDCIFYDNLVHMQTMEWHKAHKIAILANFNVKRWFFTRTLVLLLIARTNFSKFSDDWHNR